MPPQRPPTLNPLGAISRAQPAPSTKTIDDLRLAEVRQRLINSGALRKQRSANKSTAIAAMERKLIELGLPPEYARSPNDPRFRGALTAREEEMALDRQLKGIRLGGDVGIWSKLQPGTPLKTIGKTAADLPTRFGPTLDQLKAAAGVQTKTGSQQIEQIKGAPPGVGGKPPDFPLQKVITKSGTKVTTPGGPMGPFSLPPPTVSRPQATVPQAQRKFPPIIEKDGVKYYYIPGTEHYTPTKPNKNAPTK